MSELGETALRETGPRILRNHEIFETVEEEQEEDLSARKQQIMLGERGARASLCGLSWELTKYFKQYSV